MSQKQISTKDKIIKYALEIITLKGNLNFTIRDLVQSAQVNVASINYHFGNKKKLIQEIEKKVIKTLLNFQVILQNNDFPIEERLYLYSKNIIEYFVNNPGIIMVISNKLIIAEPHDQIVQNFMIENRLILFDILTKIYPHQDEEILNFKIIQFNANLYFPTLFIHDSKKIFNTLIKDPKTQEKYIHLCLNSLLNGQRK
ncbi:MAG: TetR/AcrR family transcriptional regulator [Promethearchaeota archaeon]